MYAFARGCSEFLLVWVAACLGLYFLFASRFHAPGPLWGSVVGGFLMAAAWGLLRNAWIARSQAALVEYSLQGATPYGERPYAAIGRAVVMGPPLLTPFTGKPCVLYSYELSERRTVRIGSTKSSRSEQQRLVYFSGLAMTEWGVQTQHGPVRVCGFPIPDQFEERVIDTERYYSQIRDFCSQTNFSRIGTWEIGKMLNFAAIVLREAGGPVREDLWFDGADEVLANRNSLRACRLIEQAITVDQEICVIGRFDQTHDGLVNDLNTGGLQVLAGEPAHAIGHLRSTGLVYMCFAVLLAIAGTLGNYGLLSLRERSRAAQSTIADAGEELVSAFESDDWGRFNDLLSQGVSPDSRDSVGRTLLLAAIDRGKTPAIEALMAAGADPSAAQTGWNRRPIEAAFDRGQTELVRKLRTLEAEGVFVAKNRGVPVTVESTELENLLRTYTQALDESNATLMRSVADDWPVDYLESVGRGLFKDTRPVLWRCVEGYRRMDVVTVVAQGANRSGRVEQYVVTARWIDAGWKLRRVYWDESLTFQFEEGQ